MTKEQDTEEITACRTSVVENTDGNYFADEDGNIYAVYKDNRNNQRGGKLVAVSEGKRGYYIVTLRNSKKQFVKRVHRIIAETFIPNPLNLRYVNHKNGNRADNRKVNLEWCTQSYNIWHCYNILKKNTNYPRFKRYKHTIV